ncbi:hypothetical protein M145_0526 [Bacteroides fragilis str. 34-F-2 |nr:hypothetical protein M077_0510 [Bacteroides fragilis str. 2-F-2 \
MNKVRSFSVSRTKKDDKTASVNKKYTVKIENNNSKYKTR